MMLEDNILSPYKIVIDEHNHTLYKKGVNKDGKEKEDILGYYSSIEGCLKAIVKLKVAEHPNTLNLVQYLDYYKKVHNAMVLTIRNVMAKELVVKKETKYITKTK